MLIFLLWDTFIMHQGSVKRESSLMPMNFLSASSWASTCWTWEVEEELGTLFIFHLTGSTQRKKGNTVRVIEVDMTRLPCFQEDYARGGVLCVLPAQL